MFLCRLFVIDAEIKRAVRLSDGNGMLCYPRPTFALYTARVHWIGEVSTACGYVYCTFQTVHVKWSEQGRFNSMKSEGIYVYIEFVNVFVCVCWLRMWCKKYRTMHLQMRLMILSYVIVIYLFIYMWTIFIRSFIIYSYQHYIVKLATFCSFKWNCLKIHVLR